MNILLVPLILGGAFVLPFLMARLEVKHTPTHRAPSRRSAQVTTDQPAVSPQQSVVGGT